MISSLILRILATHSQLVGDRRLYGAILGQTLDDFCGFFELSLRHVKAFCFQQGQIGRLLDSSSVAPYGVAWPTQQKSAPGSRMRLILLLDDNIYPVRYYLYVGKPLI
jgi:hypothetical protein